MTECERIIKEGIIPETFLLPETRCDFFVDKQRKKIWAVEIDLFLEFARVCKKNDLTFWGDGGTLLGAVRHDGFIPWDDDIDIIMPRKDYNRLMEIGSLEFSHPYFLQNPHTDHHYGYSFAKLRNSNTTCIPRVFVGAGFNHGIHIDIFPLDNIVLDSFEEEKKCIKNHIMKCSSYMKRNNVDLLDERQLENYEKYITESPCEEYDEIQRICSAYENVYSEYVANCTVTSLKSENQIWRKEWFNKTIYHKFENIMIPMPVSIKERLMAQYGDYMVLPPMENRGFWHPNVIWDPDRPYEDYIKDV